MELPLKPMRAWDDKGLPDWAEALGAFLTERGQGVSPSLQMLPGYHILSLGESEDAGELLISSSERLIVLMGVTLLNSSDREFAGIVTRFAREMGAIALRAPVHYASEKEFWRRLGADFIPDPVALTEAIQREKVGVEPLFGQSILVTYRNRPVLCLEPIFCTTRASGPASLAERRLAKLFGSGRPIGFASRVSAHSPWEIQKKQWDDLLAYSRLEAYEVLAKLVTESLPDAALLCPEKF
jgi:hypothetical protein